MQAIINHTVQSLAHRQCWIEVYSLIFSAAALAELGRLGTSGDPRDPSVMGSDLRGLPSTTMTPTTWISL